MLSKFILTATSMQFILLNVVTVTGEAFIAHVHGIK